MNTFASERIIFFDGDCGFCNGWVGFVSQNDPEGKFRFAPLQSQFGKDYFQSLGRPELATLGSIVMVEGRQVYVKSTAVLRILRELSGVLKYAYMFVIVPERLRDWVYMLVAKNRHRLGQKSVCELPSRKIADRLIDEKAGLRTTGDHTPG